MTPEEIDILERLRSIKMQARVIKSRLTATHPEWKQWVHEPEANRIPEEARSQIQLLEELKVRWKRLEQGYKEARHRRMIALGHEDL
jgi:hypothetical protein